MNHSRYHIFCRVVDLGSFTKAAAELGYTQSAVSQIIQSLEKDLGSVLLERRRDGLRLTSDGIQYMPFLRNMSVAEQSLAQKQQEMHGLEASTVTIDTFTSVSRTILPPLMHSFRQQFPGVDFVLRQGDYASIHEDLVNGKVDLGNVVIDSAVNLYDTAMDLDVEMGSVRINGNHQKNKYFQNGSSGTRMFLSVDMGDIDVNWSY